MSFFERYLSVWVGLCMIFGVLIGHFLPAVPTFLSHLEIATFRAGGYSYLVDDLSDDDEGRFSKCQRGGC